MSRVRVRSVVSASVVLLVVSRAAAIQFENPIDFQVKRTWSGSMLGIPAELGGMLFSPSGDTLYVVGASEASDSALYAVPVVRDAATAEVVDLGPATAVTKVFDGSVSGLDAGFEVGPAQTLFYTYWPANVLAERPGGIGGVESSYAMAAIGLPSSVAGLTFSPHVVDTGTASCR